MAILKTFDQIRRYLDIGESCLAFGLNEGSILEPGQGKKGDLAFVILQLPIARAEEDHVSISEGL